MPPTFRSLRCFRTNGAVTDEGRHEAVIGHQVPVRATSRWSDLAARWFAGPERACVYGGERGWTAAPVCF